jgi:Cu/Ag efflux pump CusA
VVVNVFGRDLDGVERTAGEVARALQSVPGAADAQLQSPSGTPRLVIRLRPADLERWGFPAVDALEFLRTAFQGDIVGQGYDGARVFNVMVTLDKASRSDVARVGEVMLKSPGGSYVALNQIADVEQSSGRSQVLHLGGQRVQTVTANVEGRDVGSFVRDAREAVAARVAPGTGVFVEFAGAAEAQAQAMRNLAFYSGVAGAGIVILLTVVTGSLRNLLLILANLPFALVGGVFMVFVTGGVLTLGSMVGFVTLFGITLRNSIMMVSHYEHLVREEGMAWGVEAAVRGAADRLSPIMMTSIVTALGLLPLAVGMDEPGREVEGPMALVIVGGLATSMALNLLILPALALRYGRFEAEAE